MKSFNINEELQIVCEFKKTRNGFKHEATLLRDGREIEKAKICYLNRTWESYEYESVIKSVLDKTKALSAEEKQACLDKCAGKASLETSSLFNTLKSVMMVGDVLTSTQKDRNDWKERMLKAGLGDKGLIMPEDWDTLSEDEKETRLNGVIQELK